MNVFSAALCCRLVAARGEVLVKDKAFVFIGGECFERGAVSLWFRTGDCCCIRLVLVIDAHVVYIHAGGNGSAVWRDAAVEIASYCKVEQNVEWFVIWCGIRVWF